MSDYLELAVVGERLKNDVLWFDSFIREFYFVSPRIMVRTAEGVLGTTSVGGQRARLIIQLLCRDGTELSRRGILGIDIVLNDLKAFCLDSVEELGFHFEVGSGGIKLDFSNDEMHNGCTQFYANNIVVRLLGPEFLKPRLTLGFEFADSDMIDAHRIEGCWRQCGKCSGAWEESPSVEISRCPDCGQLTRLVLL
ncbi:MAG: hypothetical protein WCO86_13765 [Planctomycetota bacterium]